MWRTFARRPLSRVGRSPILTLMNRSIAILSLLCLLTAGAADARVWRVPSEMADIATGLAAAQPGDTVQVAPGLYTEADLMLPEGVTLRGDPDDPTATTIDAAYAGRILTCLNLVDGGLIEGLTLAHGLDTGAGAVLCEQSDTVLRNCVFQENLSGFDGGAVVCNESAGLIEGCVFIANFASGGSGGAITCRRATPVIRRCSFRGNTALGWGGAVYCSGDGLTAQLEKCEFLDNSARVGGAVAVNGAAPSVSDSEFRRNAAFESGGAFFLSLGGEIDVADTRFEANSAPYGKIGTVGGGCRASLRCTGADPSSVEGAGIVAWDEEGCAGVGVEETTWSELKSRFR